MALTSQCRICSCKYTYTFYRVTVYLDILMWSSVLWHREFWYAVANVSEEHDIFMLFICLFIICLMTLPVTRTVCDEMIGRLVNIEIRGRIWKLSAVTYFKHDFHSCLVGMRNSPITSDRTVGPLDRSWTRDLTNMNE